jgi:hypothetical protein
MIFWVKENQQKQLGNHQVETFNQKQQMKTAEEILNSNKNQTNP